MRYIFDIFVLLIFTIPVFGHETGSSMCDSEQIELYFGLNSSDVDSAFFNNEESVGYFSEYLGGLLSDPKFNVSEISIKGFASPDGDVTLNNRLVASRTEALYSYLKETLHVPDSLITTLHSGIDWEGLRRLVEESDMDHRDDVLSILDNVPEETWGKLAPSDRWMSLIDSRNKHLMDLAGGGPYRYMCEHLYPQLRRGEVVTIYFTTNMTPLLADEVEMPTKLSTIETMPLSQLTSEPISVEGEPSDLNPLKFALKSNLLYDLLMTPNIELEIPIKDRWSIAGEWLFPWWVTKDNGNALQILSGQVEGRYWFGDRAVRPQLTGWFAGFYAGGGLYDLQWRGNGYQGEFYIAAGLSGGYAHTIIVGAT